MNELLGLVALAGIGYVIWQILAVNVFTKRTGGAPSSKPSVLSRFAYRKAAAFLETGGGNLRPLFGLTKRRPRDASFISASERRSLLTSGNQGILLGKNERLSLENSFKHVLVLGSTGSGKTSGYVIPNILTSQMSLICTDIKGELFKKTSGALKRRGFEIHALNLGDLSQSLRFNPLLRARGQYGEIKTLASILVGYGLEGSDAFWKNQATQLLSLVFWAITHLRDSECTLAKAKVLLAMISGRSGQTSMMEMIPEPDKQALFNAFCEKEDRVRSNIIASTESCLAFVDHPVIAEVSNTDNFDISYLRNRLGAFYIIIPASQLRTFAPYLSLVYFEIFAYLQSEAVTRRTMPVHLLLEEAGQIYINELDIIATTIRDKHVALSLILQDYSQMRTRHGHDRADTILRGGINTRVFLSGLSSEVTRDASEMLGTTEVMDLQTGHIMQRPLLTPQQIRQLDTKEALIIHGNYPPIRGQLIPYYETNLKGKTEISPVRFSYGYGTHQ